MSSHATPIERLQQLVALEREDITTLIIYGIGIGLMSLATPIAVQALVNTIAFGALFQPLLVLTLVLLVLVGFSDTLAALQFYVVEMLQRRLFVRLFAKAAQRLQHAEFSVHEQHYLPELSNRFFDVVTLQKTAAVMLLETLGYVLQTLIGMVLLAFYHPLLLGLDLFIVAMLAIILFVMGKHGLDTAIEQSKAKYLAAAWLENLAANALLGRSSHNRDFFQQKTQTIAQQYLDACVRHFRILARQNVGALILHAVTNTLLLGLGGWMVIERQLSLGQLIAAELVVNAMIYGLTRLGKTLDNFYELLTSVDKIGHLLDLPQEKPLGVPPQTLAQAYSVVLNNVGLPHGAGLDKLNHVHLTVAAGEHTAICGDAQHGSLFDLLFGLRPPATGYIRLNDQDLRDLNLGLLRDNVVLVRDAEIIHASIADNLGLGRELDPNGIREALITVGLQDVIAALPEHLNTTINLNGLPLSPEQCLRLTLARALLKKPRLLLLDRVLDRIDFRYARVLLDALLSDNVPWTLIASSQQPEIIGAFKRRIRLENGSALENAS
ncbi:ATP-binding cassette domain-containing protein [Methylomonas sp. MgM2]